MVLEKIKARLTICRIPLINTVVGRVGLKIDRGHRAGGKCGIVLDLDQTTLFVLAVAYHDAAHWGDPSWRL